MKTIDTQQSSARSPRDVVAVAVLDGFYGCGSGSGWSNRALIEILAEVLPVEIDLVILPVPVDAVSDGWQGEWHRGVEESLDRSGRLVQIRALDGDRCRPARCGEPELTSSVEREIGRLRGEYRRGLVVLCDVEFSGATAQSSADSAWMTVIVPRTSTLLVQPELAERVAWERESLRRAAHKGVRIAAISGYMRSHLIEQIGVPASAIVELRNGLSGVDVEPKAKADGVIDLPPAARGGFWLAMGRAVPEKGFEDLLDALCLLRDRRVRVPHVVLAAVDEGMDLSPYQWRLAGRVAREQLDVSLLIQFSPGVRALLAHRSIVGVIVPSRVEPFGRIPLEAYAAGAAPVVATRAGGLAELVVEGRSGYLAEPGDPADLAQALRRAASMDAGTRQRMREHGRELLRGFDYRDSVRSLLRQIAPWLTLSGRPSVQVSAATGGSVAGRDVTVVQVPEVCGWNPYVAAAEAALTAQGVRVVRPGLCRDVPGPAARPLRQPAEVEVDAATIVHLHWPDKLASQLGVDAATAVLRDLVERGAKIVQTVHNVRPHEATPELTAFQRLVDELTAGVHFFSPEHEAQARSIRPGLPYRVLHLPHPRFALPTPPATSTVAGSVGLLGRLRGYKRTLGFTRAYLQALDAQAQLVVAGYVDEPEIHHALAELAVEYPGLDYQPGFVPEERFWRLLGEAEWVVLPCRRLYSSGMLVAALQLGRRIISPVPTGGTGLYGTGLDQGQWQTVQPWDDTRAVEELLAAPSHLPPVGELTLPPWSEAAKTMADFYAQLLEDAAAPTARSTHAVSAAPTRCTPVPVHARSTDGEVFDFGTHANDFLVRREESLASETFLVRVPGGGAVPEHVHTDMEQTFVFVSGVGEATLSRGGQARRFCCGPGDVLFVPVGWRHTVLAQSVEGLVYLTVNSFVPGADRIGASAVAHAMAVQPSFRATGRAPRAAHAEPLAVFRSAETAFRVDESGRRMWPRDFTALDTTLRRDPNTYRVRRLGPFEYVKPVTARQRILTTELADRLFGAASGHLPVLVEGSQSPISVKAPCEESDLDILVAVECADDLTLARKVLDALAEQMDHVPVPLSLGVVHARWLDLPNFYSALSLDPAAPDRQWWTAADPDRLGEATRRIRRGLDLLQNPDLVRNLLALSLEVAGRGTEQIGEWRLIPRWSGYV